MHAIFNEIARLKPKYGNKKICNIIRYTWKS